MEGHEVNSLSWQRSSQRQPHGGRPTGSGQAGGRVSGRHGIGRRHGPRDGTTGANAAGARHRQFDRTADGVAGPGPAGRAPEPGDVGMVEAHGPGTAVGDPIEFAAVAAVYGKGRDRCALGSVKTHIGHTEPVLGVAGLLKAVAALGRGLVPASLHFSDWNPQIDPRGTRLFVPTDTVDWPVRGGARLAAVSSFGISGTNVHVVLEQPPAPRPVRRSTRPAPCAEAQDPGGGSAARLSALRRHPRGSACRGRPPARWLQGEGAHVPLGDVAHTLAVRRSPRTGAGRRRGRGPVRTGRPA
jgi:acyl transferase domain-containing protein